MGVKFRFGTDPNFSIEKLRNEGFKYINLAIGAWKSRSLHLEGNSDNIMPAIKFLREFNKDRKQIRLGKNVAVIGGGNSAMDGARAAKRIKGVENVYLIYRRTEEFMPADMEEFDNALSDGVIYKELLSPVAFDGKVLKCQKMRLGEFGIDGRRKVYPVENEFEEFEIDFVLSAIGELVDYELLRQNGIEIDDKGNIKIDSKTNETNVKGVFISGDASLGPSTVIEAVADGKTTALAIIAKEGIELVNSFDMGSNISKRILELNQRRGVLQQASAKELANAKAIENETKRCLECNSLCNMCVEVCPNRANVAIQVKSSNFSKFNQIIHIDAFCNECGNCETFCPYQGAPYKDKFTVFWNEVDFENSANNGFVFIEGDSQPSFLIRYDNQISTAKFDEDGIFQSEVPIEIKEIILEIYKNHKYLLNYSGIVDRLL